jgi:hypothetical protein
MERPDAEVVVHAFAAPAGGGGVFVDLKVQFVIGGFARAVDFVERRTVAPQEAPFAAGKGLDGDPAFVNQAMVRAAQRDEIGELVSPPSLNLCWCYIQYYTQAAEK